MTGPKLDFILAHGILSGVATMKMMSGAGSPALVTITDAVVSASDTNALTNMLDVLHHHEISCSFVQTGELESHVNLSFGAVPNPEILHFVASATGGTSLYASDLSRQKEIFGCVMNASQWAVLCSTISCSHNQPSMTSAPTNDSYEVETYLTSDPAAMLHLSCDLTGEDQMNLTLRPTYLNLGFVDDETSPKKHQRRFKPKLERHNWHYSVPLIRRKWKRFTLDLPVLVALEHRMREGWRVTSLRKPKLNKDRGNFHIHSEFSQSQYLEIILDRPFKEHIRIETVLFAPTPWQQNTSDSDVIGTNVQIDIVAPYEIHRLFHQFHHKSKDLEESLASIKHLIRYLKRVYRIDQTLASLFSLNENYAILHKPPADLATPHGVSLFKPRHSSSSRKQGSPEYELSLITTRESSHVSVKEEVIFGAFWSNVLSLPREMMQHVASPEVLILMCGCHESTYRPAINEVKLDVDRHFGWEQDAERIKTCLSDWCSFRLLEDTFVLVVKQDDENNNVDIDGDGTDESTNDPTNTNTNDATYNNANNNDDIDNGNEKPDGDEEIPARPYTHTHRHSHASFCLLRCVRQDAFVVIWTGYVMMPSADRARISASLRKLLEKATQQKVGSNNNNSTDTDMTKIPTKADVSKSSNTTTSNTTTTTNSNSNATTTSSSSSTTNVTPLLTTTSATTAEEARSNWKSKIVLLSKPSSTYHPQYMRLMVNPQLSGAAVDIPETLSAQTSHLWKTRWTWRVDIDRAGLPLTNLMCDRMLGEFNGMLMQWMHLSRKRQGFCLTSSNKYISTFTAELKVSRPDHKTLESNCGIGLETCLVQFAAVASQKKSNPISEMWLEPCHGNVVEGGKEFVGKHWQELTDVMFQRDFQFATLLITFKYLVALCGHMLLHAAHEELLVINLQQTAKKGRGSVKPRTMISGRFDQVTWIPFDVSALLQSASRTVYQYPMFPLGSSGCNGGTPSKQQQHTHKTTTQSVPSSPPSRNSSSASGNPSRISTTGSYQSRARFEPLPSAQNRTSTGDTGAVGDTHSNISSTTTTTTTTTVNANMNFDGNINANANANTNADDDTNTNTNADINIATVADTTTPQSHSATESEPCDCLASMCFASFVQKLSETNRIEILLSDKESNAISEMLLEKEMEEEAKETEEESKETEVESTSQAQTQTQENTDGNGKEQTLDLRMEKESEQRSKVEEPGIQSQPQEEPPQTPPHKQQHHQEGQQQQFQQQQEQQQRQQPPQQQQEQHTAQSKPPVRYRCFAKLLIFGAENQKACLIVTLVPQVCVHTCEAGRCLEVVVLECPGEMTLKPPERLNVTQTKVDHSLATLKDLTVGLSYRKSFDSSPTTIYETEGLRVSFIRAYVETVCTQIQLGHFVSTSIIQNVLDVCETHVNDIDLTPLIKQMDLVNEQLVAPKLDKLDHAESFRARFTTLMGQHFKASGLTSKIWVVNDNRAKTDLRDVLIGPRLPSVGPRFSDFDYAHDDVSVGTTEQSEPGSNLDTSLLLPLADDLTSNDPLFLMITCHMDIDDGDENGVEVATTDVEDTPNATVDKDPHHKEHQHQNQHQSTHALEHLPMTLTALAEALAVDPKQLGDELAQDRLRVTLRLTAAMLPNMLNKDTEVDAPQTPLDDVNITSVWADERVAKDGETLSPPATPKRTSAPFWEMPIQPQTATQALIERGMKPISSKIQWLLEDEIISLTRCSTNATVAMLQRCIAHVDVKPPLPTMSRIEHVELDFNGDEESQAKAAKIFQEELNFDRLLHHSTINYGNYTCVFPRNNTADSISRQTSRYLSTAIANTVTTTSNITETTETKTFLKPESKVLTEWSPVPFKLPSLFQDEEDQDMLINHRPQFYLLVVHNTRNIRDVMILLHTRSVVQGDEMLLMAAVRSIVIQCIRSVKELYLLEYVNETKLCSDNLVVPPPALQSPTPPPTTSTSTKTTASKTKAKSSTRSSTSIDDEIFSCRLVFQRDFQLISWLRASDALSAINQKLQIFTVQNRKNLFVYREQLTHSVFLLHFATVDALGSSSSTTTSTSSTRATTPLSSSPTSSTPTFPTNCSSVTTINTNANTNTNTNANANTNTNTTAVDSDSIRSSISASDAKWDTTRNSKFVRLQVFGVHDISSGIGKDLIEMLCGVIDALTLRQLSHKLARTASLKLQQCDVSFLQGEGVSETKIVQVPKFIWESPGFVTYLDQALLPFLLSYVGPDLNTHDDRGIDDEDDDDDDDGDDDDDDADTNSDDDEATLKNANPVENVENVEKKENQSISGDGKVQSRMHKPDISTINDSYDGDVPDEHDDGDTTLHATKRTEVDVSTEVGGDVSTNVFGDASTEVAATRPTQPSVGENVSDDDNMIKGVPLSITGGLRSSLKSGLDETLDETRQQQHHQQPHQQHQLQHQQQLSQLPSKPHRQLLQSQVLHEPRVQGDNDGVSHDKRQPSHDRPHDHDHNLKKSFTMVPPLPNTNPNLPPRLQREVDVDLKHNVDVGFQHDVDVDHNNETHQHAPENTTTPKIPYIPHATPSRLHRPSETSRSFIYNHAERTRTHQRQRSRVIFQDQRLNRKYTDRDSIREGVAGSVGTGTALVKVTFLFPHKKRKQRARRSSTLRAPSVNDDGPEHDEESNTSTLKHVLHYLKSDLFGVNDSETNVETNIGESEKSKSKAEVDQAIKSDTDTGSETETPLIPEQQPSTKKTKSMNERNCYTLKIVIFSRGAMKPHALIERIELGIKQAVSDYILETYLLRTPLKITPFRLDGDSNTRNTLGEDSFDSTPASTRPPTPTPTPAQHPTIIPTPFAVTTTTTTPPLLRKVTSMPSPPLSTSPLSTLQPSPSASTSSTLNMDLAECLLQLQKANVVNEFYSTEILTFPVTWERAPTLLEAIPEFLSCLSAAVTVHSFRATNRDIHAQESDADWDIIQEHFTEYDPSIDNSTPGDINTNNNNNNTNNNNYNNNNNNTNSDTTTNTNNGNTNATNIDANTNTKTNTDTNNFTTNTNPNTNPLYWPTTHASAHTPTTPPIFSRRLKCDGSVHGLPCVFVASNVPGWQRSSTRPLDTSPKRNLDKAMTDKATSPAREFQRLRSLDYAMFEGSIDSIVPRHMLAMVTVRNNTVTVLAYNLRNHVTQELHHKLQHTTQWSNCRARFLDDVLHTKMGLFFHLPPQPITSHPIQGKSAEGLRLLLEFSRSTPHHKSILSLSTSKKTKSAKNVISLLEGKQPRTPMHMTSHHREEDPVCRHGLQLQDATTAHTIHLANDFNAGIELLAQGWDMRLSLGSDSNFPYPKQLNQKQVEAVKRSMRPMHYVATPIICQFTDEVSHANGRARSDSVYKGLSQQISTSSVANVNDDVESQTWRQNIMEAVRNLYVKYTLSRMDFVEVHTTLKPKEEDALTFRRSTFVQYQRDFLKGGGIILFEIGSSGRFASIKLHTLSTPPELTDSDGEDSESDFHNQDPASFDRDCAKYKDLMHVNSFGYDFNVFTLVSMLKKRELPYLSFDFWNVLWSLNKLFPRLPNYRHNNVECSTIDLRAEYESDASAESIVELVCRNAPLYGMTSMIQTTNRRRFVFSFDCVPEFSDNDKFSVCVLLTPTPMERLESHTKDDSVVEFYVLQCDHVHRFPRRLRRQSGEFSTERLNFGYGYSSASDPFPFQPIVCEYARRSAIVTKWVKAMLSRALKQQRRDVLWNKFLHLTSTTEGTHALMLDLLDACETTDFEDLDPDVTSLLDLPVRWDMLVNHVTSTFGNEHVRLVYLDGGLKDGSPPSISPSSVQVLVFANHPDLMAHLSCDVTTHRVRGKIVTRNQDAEGQSSPPSTSTSTSTSTLTLTSTSTSTSTLAPSLASMSDDEDSETAITLPELARQHLSSIINTVCVHHYTLI